MKNLRSDNRVDRRDFITKSLSLGAFLGMGCPGMKAMNIQKDVSNDIKDNHKFQTPANFTYEQLFNTVFRSWFISYMKLLQEKIGTEKFLKLLTEVGDSHYQSRVKKHFKKIKDKSVESLIENFWEPVQKSKFGNSTITIEIIDKSKSKGVVKMDECLYAKTFRENDAADIGYAAICHADFAVTEEFNPNIRLTRNKCLMNGDECCLFEYLLQS
ncbi:MAG: L-2-amino-thiazoline-4-carboxylic acid hydrolase [Acidobacteriota bacterium]